jgi:mono/diheme cytochrome c family protein
MINYFIPARKSRLSILALIGVFLVSTSLFVDRIIAQEPVLPQTTPDGASGLDLYAERCANCHGDTGQGDGPLILQMGGQPPMPFDAEYRREARPSTMFEQITNGDLTVGMPPFGPASSNPIPDAGRWDLVAAVYSLATPAEDVAAGQVIYESQCAACHGDEGRGDGPEAGTDPAPTDLTALDYWFNRSNATVHSALAPGLIAAHDYETADDDLWRVVDFTRTFSYVYADPAAPVALIPAGTIFGSLSNGTTGESLADTVVTLRAFTPDFVQTLTLTTTTDAGGNYRFDVSDIEPDWVFIAGASHQELSFSSAADQLDRQLPTLELPIEVYERSTDASAINLGQLHVVLEFAEDRLRVNELYIFNNNQNAVFVGESGDPARGTVEIALPAGAENLSFQRAFGSLDSFLPANDFVPTERGWADPLPLRPGPGALNLLVRYELPYRSGMTVAHPVFYDTASSTIILPDAGVSVTGPSWVEQPPQQFGQGDTFRNYSRATIPAGEPVTIQLQGRPRLVSGAEGTALNRNMTVELLIGGAAFLLAVGAGIIVWRSWRGRREVDEEWGSVVDSAVAGETRDTQEALLKTIAELDDAYEAGQIEEAAYQRQRAELKQRLAAIWR